MPSDPTPWLMRAAGKRSPAQNTSLFYTKRTVLMVLVVLLQGAVGLGSGFQENLVRAAESVGDSAAPPSAAGRDEQLSKRQTEAIARLRRNGALVETRGQDAMLVGFLAGKAVTDAALADIEEAPDYVELSVCGPGVTDAGLKHLEKLRRIERLDLLFTKITDQGLARLKGLTTLKDLRLTGNLRITDAGLRELKALDSLRSLDLTFTKVSDFEVEALRRSLPRLTVQRRYHLPKAANTKSDTGSDAAKPTAWRLDRIQSQLFRADPASAIKSRDFATLAVLLDHELSAGPSLPLLWRYLAWNVSYNLAAGCDDVHGRYWWMKQGILMLVTGARTHPREGKLIWDTAWFVGNRLGKCDDRQQVRRLFADDAELHAALLIDIRRESVSGPSGKPDNWLVARQWFLRPSPSSIRSMPMTYRAFPRLLPGAMRRLARSIMPRHWKRTVFLANRPCGHGRRRRGFGMLLEIAQFPRSTA